MKMQNSIAVCILINLFISVAWAQVPEGKPAYDKGCSICHNNGVAGAQRLGIAADWKEPLSHGISSLYKNALEGTPRGMPARGGAYGRSLLDNEIKSAVDYMVDQVRDEIAAMPVSDADSVTKAAVAAVAPVKPVLFSFNRLLRPLDTHNLPPYEDGIHDPSDEATHKLQPPAVGMAGFVKSNFGNRVDWVQTLEKGIINPRWDRIDPEAEGIVMDMNILRVPRGSMPNVIFPHKQHTEWLDCSNCHPAIFIPHRGANQISMPLILLGQKCGVCHGKVPFPISECRKCHSQPKDLPQKAVVGKQ